jgi:hypothetical protein
LGTYLRNVDSLNRQMRSPKKRTFLMTKLALAASLAVAVGFTVPNAALAKGGYGHGHGYGHTIGHGHYHGTPPGWSHGRKVGWRGMGCPPGLWKQGRC